MIYISHMASAEDVLQVVQAWVDLWAEMGSEAVFTAIALDKHDTWTPEWLERTITNYRPLELYPNTSQFTVTSPAAATITNHVPTQEMKWYDPKNTELAGDVRFDLPLNGHWSDLLADFDLWGRSDSGEDYVLALDEIRCWDQYWSEQESTAS